MWATKKLDDKISIAALASTPSPCTYRCAGAAISCEGPGVSGLCSACTDTGELRGIHRGQRIEASGLRCRTAVDGGIAAFWLAWLAWLAGRPRRRVPVPFGWVWVSAYAGNYITYLRRLLSLFSPVAARKARNDREAAAYRNHACGVIRGEEEAGGKGERRQERSGSAGTGSHHRRRLGPEDGVGGPSRTLTTDTGLSWPYA